MNVFRGDLNVEIDDSELPVDENPCTINWPPTIHTNIPETFDFAQEWPENLTEEQEKFLGEIRGLIDETRIASLCCELVCFQNILSFKLFGNFLEFIRSCLLAYINSSDCFQTFHSFQTSFKCNYPSLPLLIH